MTARPHARPHGQMRMSQTVTIFGPGALLDLPNHSVLVSGLDHWHRGEEIQEPRLLAKLKELLELHELRMYSPPPDPEDPTAPRTGIRVWQFPEWFITQDVESRSSLPPVRTRRLVHRAALTRGKFIDDDKKKRPVVPVRFVRACRRGHIGDLDWFGFVHVDGKQCRRALFIDERGTSGDLGEVWVRCACGAERPMSEAAGASIASGLGTCDGSRPWLGPFARESCGEPNRLLVRTASNAYFSQVMRVISLPPRDEAIKAAVDQVWEFFLQYLTSVEELQQERTRKPPVHQALDGLSDDEVFAEIERRKKGAEARADKPVKQAELETLAACEDEIGNDQPDGDFFARALPRDKWDEPWMSGIGRVVLVHRLREVSALVGFTRFEASAPDVDGELEMGVRRAALAREMTWVPAVENRGEGVFLHFDTDAIARWLERPEVKERGKRLMGGFDLWKAGRPSSRREWPGLPYVMLHTLSHLLITAVSLECGYPASSIRERVYAGKDAYGYGILLYTGSPDAEGTLGGLVEVGRRISRHVRSALEMARLCANDPVCAQHAPQSTHEARYLHGAACHGCLLIAETSCEQHNEFLDRALVVPTVATSGAEFFSDHV